MTIEDEEHDSSPQPDATSANDRDATEDGALPAQPQHGVETRIHQMSRQQLDSIPEVESSESNDNEAELTAEENASEGQGCRTAPDAEDRDGVVVPIPAAPAGADPNDPNVWTDLRAGGESFEEWFNPPSTNRGFEDIRYDEFVGFETDSGTAPVSPFTLNLPSIHIHECVAIHRAAGRPGKKLGLLRLSCRRDIIKFQGFETNFFELSIFLPNACTLSAEANVVLFIRGEDLEVAAKAIAEDVTIYVDPTEKHLILSSGKFERPLALAASSGFTQLSDKHIGTVDPICRRDVPQAFASALRHVAPHATYDDLRAQFNAIESRNGIVVAGSPTVFAQYGSAELKDLQLCVRFDDCNTILRIFETDAAIILRETQLFYIFRAGGRSLGIPKYKHPSPFFQLGIKGRTDSGRILFPRRSLVAALTTIEHAVGPCALRMKADDFGKVDVQLSASNKDGTSISVIVEGYSTYPSFELRAASAALLSTVEKSVSSNVDIALGREHICVDDSDDKDTAITLISTIHPGKKDGRKTAMKEEAFDVQRQDQSRALRI